MGTLETATALADQVAALRGPMEAKDLAVSITGRAYLRGAEDALRALVREVECSNGSDTFTDTEV